MNHFINFNVIKVFERGFEISCFVVVENIEVMVVAFMQYLLLY